MSALESIADSFVRSHLKRNPGLELVQVHCAVDKRAVHAASAADVNAFLRTLDQDQAIRFDVSDTEVADEIVHALPEPEPDDVVLDLDATVEKLVLARRRKAHYVYFAGFLKHRPIWTTDARQAHVFGGDSEIIEVVFQFASDGEAIAILRESFSGLDLQILAAPSLPSF